MPDLRGGDAASVISELTKALHADGVVTDSLAFYHAALNREYLAPTQVSHVIAFPHARSPVVNRLAFAVGRSQAPIAWGKAGDTVKLVFLAAIPPSSAGAYLALMSAFACLIRNSILRNEILAATRPHEILNLLEHAQARTALAQRVAQEVE
jgi:mannitol/fructose-specific phosphotransferase system IIA component (Ntr-type)